MYELTTYATGQDNPKATWLGLSDTDPSLANGWETTEGKLQTLAGGWDSIHKPSHLYPPPHGSMFDPDIATKTL